MLSAMTLPGLILLVQFTPRMKTDLVSLNPLMGLVPLHARSFGGSGKKIELGSRADRIGTGCAALGIEQRSLSLILALQPQLISFLLIS